jgi:PPOX class probable F420-dependent enzyme
MHLADALSFIRGRRQGVVTTIRSGGRPQLSNIVYALGDDDVARISVTDSRAKTRNLRRDPPASLYVVGDDVRSYVVLDGTAELTPVAAGRADAAVDELADLYQRVSGERPARAVPVIARVSSLRATLRRFATSNWLAN